MPTVIIWMLIASGTGPPVVIERFASEQACTAAGKQIETKSREKPSMVSIQTICIQIQK